MKLHLPKTLLTAVMACTATFGGLFTTIGTGLITGGAMTIAFVAQEAGAYVNTTYEYSGAETLTGGATVTPTENTHYTVTDTLKHYTISQNGDNKYHVKISGQAGNETHLDSVATESLLIQSGRWRIENAGALTNAGHIYMGGGQIQFGVNQELSNDFTIGQTTMYADASTLSHSAFRVGDNEGQISVTLTGNLTVQENARISYQNSGKLYITGALSGSGNIELDRYNGTGVLSISGKDKTYTGTITGHANVNMVLAANMSGATLDTKGSLSLGADAVTIKALKGNGTLMLSEVANATLTVTGANGTFSGEIGKNVTLNITGGTQVISGATLGSTIQVGTGATLKLSGDIILSYFMPVMATANGFEASAVVASGAGMVNATDVTSWFVDGAQRTGSFENGLFKYTTTEYGVRVADEVVSAENVAKATGYVVEESLTATVQNATSAGLASVVLKNDSTLKLSSDAAVEYTGGSFNVAGVAKLELTGDGIVWNKQITCADADSALQLTVTDGSNVLWSALPHSGTGQGVNNVIVGVNSTLTVSETSTQYPIFNGNLNQDTTITLKEGATLNSGNLFGWYTDGDPRACTRVVNLEKNSTWNILSGGGSFYINRTTINLSGAKIVLGDGVSMNFERPNGNDVNVFSTTATAEQMSLITAAAGSATAGTLKFQNTGGVFDISRGSFTLDETNTADLKVDVAIVKGNGDKKLTKKGDGVLELTKNNTYTGGTEVQNGTLVAAAKTALGTGKVLVNGGTLKGTVGLNISELEHTSGTILLTEGETSITKGLSTTAIDLTGTSKLVLGIADNDDANKKFSIGKTVGKANLQLNEGSVELGGSTHELNHFDISNAGKSNAQVTLKSGAVVSTNGQMWLGTDAGITLENTASLAIGTVTISGDKESVDGSIARDAGGDQYTSDHANYTISNSKITIAQNSEKGNGWTDLKNKLRNTAVANDGNDVVVVHLDADFDISGIEANKGNVNLVYMSKDAELAYLKLAAGLKVGAHKDKTGIGSGTDFKTLSVVDVVAMGAGSVVDGNLSLGEKATLKLSGITAESSTAIIEGNLTLTKGNLTLSGDVLKALAEIEAGERLTIMTIGENLIVNDQVITESITADSEGYSFAEVFTNAGYDDFYLGFDYMPDEAGYRTVYIGMIVPEPTTATLSLLALAALAARRRRK